MSSATQNKNNLASYHPTPQMQRSRASGFDIYLIGLMVLAVFVVAVAQLVTQYQ
jgi:hypothetical protein